MNFAIYVSYRAIWYIYLFQISKKKRSKFEKKNNLDASSKCCITLYVLYVSAHKTKSNRNVV